MKQLFSLLVFVFIFQTSNAQNEQPNISKPDPTKKVLIVELSCGECKFKK